MDHDYHSSSSAPSAASTAQQGVVGESSARVGESSARNILDILQQKEAPSKVESQAGNVPSTPQPGEYAVYFAGSAQQYRVVRTCLSSAGHGRLTGQLWIWSSKFH